MVELDVREGREPRREFSFQDTAQQPSIHVPFWGLVHRLLPYPDTLLYTHGCVSCGVYNLFCTAPIAWLLVHALMGLLAHSPVTSSICGRLHMKSFSTCVIRGRVDTHVLSQSHRLRMGVRGKELGRAQFSLNILQCRAWANGSTHLYWMVGIAPIKSAITASSGEVVSDWGTLGARGAFWGATTHGPRATGPGIAKKIFAVARVPAPSATACLSRIAGASRSGAMEEIKTAAARMT